MCLPPLKGGAWRCPFKASRWPVSLSSKLPERALFSLSSLSLSVSLSCVANAQRGVILRFLGCPMEDAKSDETQRVQILRSRLQASCPEASEINELDDATLRRFLCARSLNVEKACKFVLQHLKWRHAVMPLGCIRETEIVNELKKEKIFLQGVDKKGRPIGVILARRHDSSARDLEEFKRFVVYAFEKAVSRLSGDQEKFVLIADLKGYNRKNMDLKGYLSILQILQEHYPERLGKLFMLRVPSLFSIAWRIVYPFIDPNVRQKIIFVEDREIKDTLLKDIDMKELPVDFGGQLPLMPIQNVGLATMP